MARKRSATKDVINLSRSAIESALRASIESENDSAFRSEIGMRNPSRSYFVQADGRRHSVKALVVYALRKDNPNAVSTDFHAADAAKRLRMLKFNVIHLTLETDQQRELEWIKRLKRTGQTKFRRILLDLFESCPLTNCSTQTALEAAHVQTVKEKGIDAANNGILLRADLHKLFDADLLAINPKTGAIALSDECVQDYALLLKKARYKAIQGGPALSAFQDRWDRFKRRIPQ